jgi:AcrR family transcriptional regulator
MSRVRQKQMKRRTEILERVMDLLKTAPFEKISVRDICVASGISIGSFYHYFTQKSELLAGLMGLIDVYMQAHVFPLLTDGSEYENLKTISRGFAAHIEECGIEMSKLISGHRPAENEINNEKRPLCQKLEEVVAAGQRKGEFKASPAPEKTAELLLIAMSGVSVDWSRRDGNYPIGERMEEFAELFFPALLCAEPPRPFL